MRLAQCSAERCPFVGTRADAVIHMQGGEFPVAKGNKPGQEMQQHDGIHSAAQTQQNRTAVGNQGRERIADAPLQIT